LRDVRWLAGSSSFGPVRAVGKWATLFCHIRCSWSPPRVSLPRSDAVFNARRAGGAEAYPVRAYRRFVLAGWIRVVALGLAIGPAAINAPPVFPYRAACLVTASRAGHHLPALLLFFASDASKIAFGVHHGVFPVIVTVGGRAEP